MAEKSDLKWPKNGQKYPFGNEFWIRRCDFQKSNGHPKKFSPAAGPAIGPLCGGPKGNPVIIAREEKEKRIKESENGYSVFA